MSREVLGILLFIFAISVLFFFYERNKINEHSVFKKEYRKLEIYVKNNQITYEQFLCYLLLHPIYLLYYDKKSLFYHDNKCCISLIIFNLFTIMNTNKLTITEKLNVIDCMKYFSQFIETAFCINSVELSKLSKSQNKLYKDAFSRKQNIFDIFVSFIINIKQKNFTLDEIKINIECQIIFQNITTELIDTTKEWCRLYEEYEKKTRGDVDS